MRPAPEDDPCRRLLAMGPRVVALPVVHGSADFALAVRDEMLKGRYDCLAVPLPPSWRDEVVRAVRDLPRVSCVSQAMDDEGERRSYVPIDPCQPVIRGIRTALGERMHVAFVDQEIRDLERTAAVFPDPFALRNLDPARFAAAVVPAVDPPVAESQQDQRCRRMAFELHRLELEHERILFLPSVLDWPFIRDAWQRRLPYPESVAVFSPLETHPVALNSLFFFLAEIPWITGLYEKKRFSLDEECSLSVDGTKELLLETRDRAVSKRRSLEKRLSIKTLVLYLQYVRNLTLIRRRLRPELMTLVEAAKQVMGDDFAIELLGTAREYPFDWEDDGPRPMRMGVEAAEFPEIGTVEMTTRLPGHAIEWRDIDLRRRPDEPERDRWKQIWNPWSQCSWPPEDARIESFNLHVREQAKNLISSDLARVEKFSSSIKDGIDMRETLRNWHTGEIYVRELPPARGSIEVVVFLFDVPADPRLYAWRTTWFAEHAQESTLVFFATDWSRNLVGPGVAEARYGGAFFLFPPRPIFDVWREPSLRGLDTLEERLLGGAFLHSQERHVAVVSPCPLKSSWRRLARRFGKVAVHLPLSRFSASTVERLRTFHVLNGKEVRSYASEFIRRTE